MRNELVCSLEAEWELSRSVVRQCLTRFVRECPELTERELRQYLRAALLVRNGQPNPSAFPGLIDATKPVGDQPIFGRVCTRDRLEQWRKTQRGDVRDTRPQKVELTCNVCEHTQRGIVRDTTRSVACRNCGARINIFSDDDKAIAEIIAGASR